MVLEERKLEVLRAIVTDFVSTHEPVGSKVLSERHHLGVSPATVRNDMAALEEEGYLTQPHTSAGRVPTDKGYRLFVDRLSTIKPLSVAERKAIESFLNGAIDLDDVVLRSVRLLAQLTRQVAVVQYPSLSRSSVRHVELVALSPRRILVVVITDSGRVEQRTVDLPTDVTEDELIALRTAVGAGLAGRRFIDAPVVLAALPEAVPNELRRVAGALAGVLLEALVERQEERVAVSGTANLARSAPYDFPQTLRPVLEALEEQVVLLKLLGAGTDPGALTVTIGGENDVEGLRTTSVVAAGYGVTSGSGGSLGSLGVVGPTRMDYPASMATVDAVARYLAEILGGRS